jgi:hypothetical protein
MSHPGLLWITVRVLAGKKSRKTEEDEVLEIASEEVETGKKSGAERFRLQDLEFLVNITELFEEAVTKGLPAEEFMKRLNKLQA